MMPCPGLTQNGYVWARVGCFCNFNIAHLPCHTEGYKLMLQATPSRLFCELLPFPIRGHPRWFVEGLRLENIGLSLFDRPGG